LSEGEVKINDSEKFSHGHRPSLLTNALSNWAPLVVNIIIGFVLTPYLINHLGKKNYGIWALVGSFLGYYGLLRLGVGPGIMRYVPFYKGSNDHKAASQIISTGMAIFLVVGLAIFVLSMRLAEPIARFYEGGPELALLIRILGAAAALECPSRILEACIRSHERWISANFVSIAASITRALGLATCVHLGYTVIEMGYVVFVVTIFSFAFMAVVFIRTCPDIQLRPSMVKLSRAWTLLSYGVMTTVIVLVYTRALQGHSLIIGKLVSLEAVAIYAVPVLIMRNIRNLSAAPARVFHPRFAYLDGNNQPEEIVSLFLRGTRFAAILASGTILFALVGGQPFIRLWIGEGFEEAYPVLIILAIGFLIETSFVLINPLFCGTGRQKIYAALALIQGIVGIGLSIILTWQFGLVGSPIGFAITAILMHGLVCPWYVCRVWRIGMFRYYIDCVMRPWLILLALTSVVYCIGVQESVSNWPHFIIFLLAVGCLYAFCTYTISMKADEKEIMLNLFKKLSMLKWFSFKLYR
jgi:O-antigen/teichoic acid export membrane protein